MHKNRQWTPDELAMIAGSDDLKVSPLRQDGLTYGTPTWIWNVAVAGNLYVRPYNGTKSSWYQAALRQKFGRIHAGGLVIEVEFGSVIEAENVEIDDAYRAKYKDSPYLAHMIGQKVRSTTIKIIPRGK